eukprot:Em0535g5a
MENADAKEAKYATVTNRSDGEGCKGAREERSGEANYSKLPCLSEQSKTISFNILLLRTPHNTTTSRTFTTTKFPESVAALKLAIQEEFQVPVYDQKLSFDFAVLADGESLGFYRLKDGDQITLEYTTTVDLECAFHLMSLLRNALEFVNNEQSQLASGNISPEFSKTITDTLHVKDINQCIKQLFPPQKCFANSMFILNNRGLDVTTSLHSTLLLNQTWEQICHLDLQHLEYNVLMARRYVWADIFPPLSLVYSPLRYTSLCPIDSLCLEAAVMRLQIIVSKDGERHCLIKQGLLDYLICLPWHISEGLEAHKRAKLVLEMFGSHIPLQPPSLNNITVIDQLAGFYQETASSRPHEGDIWTTVQLDK